MPPAPADDAPAAPAPLAAFAAANDLAAGTPKRLEKQAHLAAYLREIRSDADLRRAVHYAGGHPFAATDERTTGVSGATFAAAVTARFALDPADWRARSVKHGEAGEALADLFAEKQPDPAGEPLALADLADVFDALAETGNFEAKRSILRAALDRLRTPREAAYLAKILFGDLRTGVREGALQAAVADAFGRDLAAVQRAHLLVGDLGEVAQLARHDRLAAATFTLFHPVQFMLAIPVEDAAEAASRVGSRSKGVGGEDASADPSTHNLLPTTFSAEDKLDGIRAQIHKSGGRLAIYTRTMDRADESFPDVLAAVARLPGEFLLDGEIVPCRDGVVLPFNHIQKRLGRKVLTPKMLADNPCVFIAFDCLYLDGELLMDGPLTGRREKLNKLVSRERSERFSPDESKSARSARGSTETILISEPTPVSTESDIAAAFDRARANRNEGLVLKDPRSAYTPGRRGGAWLKLKGHLPTLDCVVTAAETGHGKRRNSLSDYTFAVWTADPETDGATLVNVGKAFSGVTDAEIARLTDLFRGITLQTRGRVHAVRPQVVLEIACDSVQASKRHASGYALRFPRIKRIRWDKKPADADRLARVVELYEHDSNFGRAAAAAKAQTPAEPTLFDGF